MPLFYCTGDRLTTVAQATSKTLESGSMEGLDALGTPNCLQNGPPDTGFERGRERTGLHVVAETDGLLKGRHEQFAIGAKAHVLANLLADF